VKTACTSWVRPCRLTAGPFRGLFNKKKTRFFVLSSWRRRKHCSQWGILVQSVLLWISQPDFQTQSIITRLCVPAPSDVARCLHTCDEGTGTRPDYLVNRVLTKNEATHPKKIVRKARNSLKVNSGSVRQPYSCLGAQIGSVLKPIQTLKEYFSCHVYCAHLGTLWYQIVGSSRTVSNRESRYPPCDPMFHGLYFSDHPCLRFPGLGVHTYHVHIKNWNL